MYVKVLYDDKAKRGLIPGKGFACLIGDKILFDTGGDASTLLENMARLMVSVDDLEAVVISHDHWDHTGGLWELLKRKKGLKVYACPSFSESFKKCVEELGGKLILTEERKKIGDNVYVTGAIAGKHKDGDISEQALIIKGEKGVSVINGCAHPGVVKIVEHVLKDMKVDELYMVLGGFHVDDEDREAISGMVSKLASLGVKRIGPTHCAGPKARRIITGKYHSNCIPVKAGHIIQL
jgi:7,8-dihydropterin-6-yl-methyl-4-(beta-D-ribofuranosyl)aminobenzene 5'-phosphate synthase